MQREMTRFGQVDFFNSFLYLCDMESQEKQKGQGLFQRFANKYTLVGAIFLVWILLFDKYSVVNQMELRSKIKELEQEKRLYQERIETDRRKMEELTGDRDKLEKFAREQYLMKRDNEDIFIIVKE